MRKNDGKNTKRSAASSRAEDFREAVQEAIGSLAEKGLIVDSGRRRLNKRTGRYEIVWVAVDPTAKLH